MAVPTGFPLSPASSHASLRAFAEGTATTDWAAHAYIWSTMAGASTYVGIPVVKAGGTVTYVASGSASAVLPQSTIYVTSTAAFPTSGSVAVMTTSGIKTVTYSGKTDTSFTGCSGGDGIMVLGGEVWTISSVTAAAQSAPIYCQNIRICNDDTTNPLVFTFDGTNTAGKVLKGESVIYRDRKEAGIAVAATTGTAVFRIEAW